MNRGASLASMIGRFTVVDSPPTGNSNPLHWSNTMGKERSIGSVKYGLIKSLVTSGLLLGMLCGSATATMESSSITYNLELNPGCIVLVSAPNIMLYSGPGGFDTLDDVPAGTLSVSCNEDTPVTLCADSGMNWDSGFRRLTSGPNRIAYSLLWEDGAGTEQAFGDAGCSGVDPDYSETPTSGPPYSTTVAAVEREILDVYADIGFAPDQAAGLYEDTVTFTVIF